MTDAWSVSRSGSSPLFEVISHRESLRKIMPPSWSVTHTYCSYMSPITISVKRSMSITP